MNKRYKNIKVLALGLMLSGSLFSCTDGFEELNKNPKATSDSRPQFVLTAVERNMANRYWGEDVNENTGKILSQYWANNQYTQSSNFEFRSGHINRMFGRAYFRDLQDLKRIQELIQSELSGGVLTQAEANNQIAVAKILEAYVYQVTTDTFGKIPFSETLQAPDNIEPKYDSMADVYAGIVSLLNEAITLIDTKSGSYAAGDIIFNGESGSWLKFAHSLRIRVALRMIDVNPGEAEILIRESADKGVLTNADNVGFQYLGSQPNGSPLWEDRLTRSDFGMANTLVDKLKSFNDPRLPKYADPVDGEFIGIPFGEAGGTSYSQPSTTNVFKADDKAIFMDASATLFSLAEAAERGISVGNTAEYYYNAAITASMEEWNVSSADITAYLKQSNVAYTTAEGSYKEKIGTQKWIALYLQGNEAWAEWRRLDAPTFNKPNEKEIPTRLTYPVAEQEINGVNYQNAISDQPDELSTKLWWDKY